MSRADTAIRQARIVVDYLDSVDPKHANAVRDVIRSLSVARASMAVLHRDNMRLRDELAELKNAKQPQSSHDVKQEITR